MKTLRKFDIEVIVDKANKHTKPTQYQWLSKDRNIAIIKRK